MFFFFLVSWVCGIRERVIEVVLFLEKLEVEELCCEDVKGV